MYTRLEDKYTREYYSQVLAETTQMVKALAESDEHPIWKKILSELVDIRQNIVDNQYLTDWDDINEKYDIGRLALQIFDQEDELGQRLCDIFDGAVNYTEMPIG